MRNFTELPDLQDESFDRTMEEDFAKQFKQTAQQTDDDLITVAEAAELIGRHPSQIYILLRKDLLRAVVKRQHTPRLYVSKMQLMQLLRHATVYNTANYRWTNCE